MTEKALANKQTQAQEYIFTNSQSFPNIYINYLPSFLVVCSFLCSHFPERNSNAVSRA